MFNFLQNLHFLRLVLLYVSFIKCSWPEKISSVVLVGYVNFNSVDEHLIPHLVVPSPDSLPDPQFKILNKLCLMF